jgi:hypothetical protein
VETCNHSISAEQLDRYTADSTIERYCTYEHKTTTTIMVVIINGEIVQDDDPRAIARRAKLAGGTGSTTTNTTPTRRGLATLNNTPPANNAPPPPPQPGEPDPDGPLGQLARTIGIHGKFLTIPPITFLRTNEQKVPLIECIIATLICTLWGKTGLAIVLLYVATMKLG